MLQGMPCAFQRGQGNIKNKYDKDKMEIEIGRAGDNGQVGGY